MVPDMQKYVALDLSENAVCCSGEVTRCLEHIRDLLWDTNRKDEKVATPKIQGLIQSPYDGIFDTTDCISIGTQAIILMRLTATPAASLTRSEMCTNESRLCISESFLGRL